MNTPSDRAVVPAPSPDAPTRSPGLQMARGLAALGVAVFHIGFYAHEIFKDGFLLGVSNRLGVYGVTVFFCISGYLMAGLCREQRPGPFILHRIFRIYPTYLLVVVLVLADHLVRSGSLGPLADLGWKRALKSISLLPLGVYYRPLAVEWTLIYEVSFYFIISAFCFRPLRPLLTGFLWLWGAATIAACALGAVSPMQPKAHEMPLSLWNLGFIGGGLLRSQERRPFFRWIGPFLGLVLLLTAEAFGGTWMHVQLPVAATFLLGGILHRERPGEEAGASWIGSALVRLGDWSYALYLCHVPVATAVLSRLHARGKISPGAAAAAALGCALAVAAVLGACDRRLHAWGKHAARRLLQGPAWGRRIAGLSGALALAVVLYSSLRPLLPSRPKAAPGGTPATAWMPEFPAGTPLAEVVARLKGRGLKENAAEVMGSVDYVDRTPVDSRVSGWALDRTAGSHAASVLIFDAGALVASVQASGPRPDVVAALNLDPRAFGTIAYDTRVKALLEVPRMSALAVGPAGFNALTLAQRLRPPADPGPGRR